MISKINNTLENRLYSKIFKTEKVDFSKSWFHILTPYKFYLFGGWLFLFIERSIEASLPFLIVGLFNGVLSIWQVTFVTVISFVISPIGFNLFARVEKQLYKNIDFSVSDKVLQIDPIHHTTKSSSFLVGKLKKGLGQLSKILFEIIINIPSQLIFLIVSLISLALIDIFIATMVLVMIFFAIASNLLFREKLMKPFKAKAIKSDDAYTETMFENITQAQLIRNNFATNERSQLLSTKFDSQHRDFLNSNLAFSFSFTFTKMLLFVPIPITSYLLYQKVIDGSLEPTIAIATMTSCVFGLLQIISVGGQALKIYDSHTEVKSMFDNFNRIGNQTFPVIKN